VNDAPLEKVIDRPSLSTEKINEKPLEKSNDKPELAVNVSQEKINFSTGDIKDDAAMNICPKCEKTVFSDFILVSDRCWHNDCFTCQECNAKLNEGYRKDTGGLLFCYRCYNKLKGKLCGVCNEPIGKYKISAIGTTFHPNCFKCIECTSSLDEGYYERNKKGPYCDNCDAKFDIV